MSGGLNVLEDLYNIKTSSSDSAHKYAVLAVEYYLAGTPP